VMPGVRWLHFLMRDRKTMKDMKSLPLRFLTAVIAFVVGLGLTGLWFVTQGPALPLVRQIGFSTTATHSGANSDYYHYEASDGVKLMRARIAFPSPGRAGQELWHKLELDEEIAEILERGPKVNERGEGVGERVVAVLTGKVKGQLTYVIWTEGQALCWIESPSLNHALELERAGRF
jgi:hypothetical protein